MEGMCMPRFRPSGGILHADWPIYPCGGGAPIALETLCWFPRDTHFEVVEEIDQCLLLAAAEHRNPHVPDPYSEDHFHVAVSNEDLGSLEKEGWVVGLASPAEDLDEPIGQRIEPGGFVVSRAGWSELDHRVPFENPLHERIRSRVQPLLDIRYFDSAVRESLIVVETRLRELASSHEQGVMLAEDFCAKSERNEFSLHLRAELRTLFAFIPTEFAHRFITDDTRCRTVLRRITQTYEMLE